MIPVKVTISVAPDWAKVSREFPSTKAAILLRSAVEMIIDCTTKIIMGQTFDGGEQKENSPRWKAHKQKTKGHEIPLVYDQVLSNPAMWLINGHPAQKFIEIYARKAARRPGVKILPWRGYENNVSVAFPIRRQVVVGELESIGYDVPFGISPEVHAILGEIAELELIGFVEKAEGYRLRLGAEKFWTRLGRG